MALRDWFWLYRAVEPLGRAQTVQVINTARAMAVRGHRVTVCVQTQLTPRQVLDAFDMQPHEGMCLHTLPISNTAASFRYWSLFAAWMLRTRGRGVVYARNKRHAARAIRATRGRAHLFVEAHEVDSLLAEERGCSSAAARRREQQAYLPARGIVANAPGTLRLLRNAWPELPPSVAVPNGARRHAPDGCASGTGIGYVGSLRSYKDAQTLARASASVDVPIRVVGPDAAACRALNAKVGGRLIATDGVLPREVPALLRSFRTLVLPLSRGLFGDALTSPLKLWDALQSGVPLVAADTQAVRDAAPDGWHPYTPGDPQSLASALTRLHGDEALRERVSKEARRHRRHWDDRADEIERFVDDVMG